MTVAAAKLIFALAVSATFLIRYPHQSHSRMTPVRASQHFGE